MTRRFQFDSPLEEAFTALRTDLTGDQGPAISGIQNYRFAILPYPPHSEFEIRPLARRLVSDLEAAGWVVLSIDLQKLLLDRIRAQGEAWPERAIRREKTLSRRDPSRGLNNLTGDLSRLIDGEEGLAKDCSRIILDHLERNPDTQDRTLALIGRAGGLYPFLRSSALLRHLDGNTGNVPVVLLYPGERRGRTGLSFMGVLPAANDYRPRIYGAHHEDS